MLGRSFQATVAARQSGSVPIRLYNVGSYIKEQIIVKLRKLVNLECKILVMDVKYWLVTSAKTHIEFHDDGL